MGVDLEDGAFVDLAGDEGSCDAALELVLEVSLERPGAVGGVEAWRATCSRAASVSSSRREGAGRFEKLRTAMEAGLAEPRFNVDELAAELFMSRRQLLRKVQALTGEAPGDLLRRLRLERAAALLRGGASVKEVARAVGFRSAPHFSQAFREAHGATPAAWRADNAAGGPSSD